MTLGKELERRNRRNRLAAYQPYNKQREFHDAGATYRQRLFMAGNQLGKTVAGSMEWAMHLTGKYPVWWKGRRFQDPVRLWAAGETRLSTRDTIQKLMVGEPEQEAEWGTGAIPGDDLLSWSRTVGVPNGLDSVTVRHITGGTSTLLFKAYEQGREKWQGDTLHAVWFDEEPALDIYTEGLTRTNATNGMVMLTFTPLKGMSDVVQLFLSGEELKDDATASIKRDDQGRHVTRMTIDDAEHYTAEQREAIKASYPVHERKARAMGIPILGSGRVFPVDEDSIKVKAFDIPEDWPQIGGLDFGWDHPTAACRLAWDKDTDVLYVTACYAAREATPVQHAAALKPWGELLPWAWPHDGLQHDKGSGEALAAMYAAQGLKMLPERATFENGGNGVEAGVTEMLERMQTGRWKVFDHLEEWFNEFRMYHRKDGLIVARNDDRLSASRYAMMMKRFARKKALIRKKRPLLGGVGSWMG